MISFLKYNFIILSSLFLIQPEKISLHCETKSLKEGKMIKYISDIYFHYKDGKMITHYTYPHDYIYISDKLGQARLYYPDKNEVFMKTDHLFTTDNTLLYIFLNNQYQDMGLSNLHFTIIRTKFEDQYTISAWQAPADLCKRISQINLVHKNNIPVFAEYLLNGRVLRKIYYENYYQNNYSVLPKTITEIEYTSQGDSVINKITFSNIETGSMANSSYFDYKIPENAKLIESKTNH